MASPAGASSWAEDLKQHEAGKRWVVPPAAFAAAPWKLQKGEHAAAERTFNPVTQRFTIPEHDKQLDRQLQQTALQHLNLARDVQLLREQPHDLLNHEPKMPPTGLECSQRPRARDGLTSSTDYNIVSNIVHPEHHFSHPSQRPPAFDRSPRARKVPCWTQKDFNVVSNRYVKDHEEKAERDKSLNKVEAGLKAQRLSRFNPVLQSFNDPELEVRLQNVHAAMNNETHLRRAHLEPPSSRARFFNPVSNVADAEAAQRAEEAEGARTSRYHHRRQVETYHQRRDISEDGLRQTRGLNRVHRDRHKVHLERGHDILTNRPFEGHGASPPNPPCYEPEAPQGPWEKAATVLPERESSGGPIHKWTDRRVTLRTQPQFPNAPDRCGPERVRSPARSLSRKSARHGCETRQSSVSMARQHLPPPAPEVPGGLQSVPFCSASMQ